MWEAYSIITTQKNKSDNTTLCMDKKKCFLSVIWEGGNHISNTLEEKNYMFLSYNPDWLLSCNMTDVGWR